jgi:hypothetical protein
MCSFPPRNRLHPSSDGNTAGRDAETHLHHNRSCSSPSHALLPYLSVAGTACWRSFTSPSTGTSHNRAWLGHFVGGLVDVSDRKSAALRRTSCERAGTLPAERLRIRPSHCRWPSTDEWGQLVCDHDGRSAVSARHRCAASRASPVGRLQGAAAGPPARPQPEAAPRSRRAPTPGLRRHRAGRAQRR